MLVNIIQNTISSFVSAGISVITTNLKMWLGFETSETLGREEVVDGDFPLPNVNWTEGTGWDIDEGKAVCDGTQTGNTGLIQLLSVSNIAAGKTYKLSYTISNYVNGLVNPHIRGAFIGNVSGNGDKVAYIVAGSSTSYAINFFADSNFNAEISNVSVKELTQITPDKSGNNNVGELFTGKALEFNGSTDYVTADGFAGTLSDNTAFTIVMWFKSNQVSQAVPYQNIQMSGLKSDGETNVFKFGASANSTLKGIHYQDTAGPLNNYKINDTVNYNDNVWHRLVITRRSGTNPQTANFYVDGVNIGNCPSQIVWSDLAKFSIGQEYDSGNTPSDFFKGLISDVQIYDKDWLQADITYDYANPNKLAIDNPSTSLSVTNLKAYWAMSEGAGSLVYDSSGEGNNGTINGATYEPAQPRIPQLGMINWSKGSNLFSYSQNFNLWNKEATVTLTPKYGTSPSGANDSTRIQMNANDSLYLDNKGSSKTFSIYVKGTQGETIRLSNGVGQIFTLTGNWDRIQLYDTSASSTLYSINTYNGATARDMEIWGGQLEDSSSASAYRLTNGAATLNSTVIPNPTTPTKDIFGNLVRDRLNSFNLDGSGYAEVADDTTLQFGTGAFTMECWLTAKFVQQNSTGTNTAVSFGGDSAANGSAGILLSSTKIRFYVSNSLCEANSNFVSDDWYHVVGTRDGSGNCKLYIDSTLQNNTAVDTGSVTSQSSVKLIGKDTNVNRFYNGIVSDVRLYDRALSSDEIENNYNAGLSAHTN